MTSHAGEAFTVCNTGGSAPSKTALWLRGLALTSLSLPLISWLANLAGHYSPDAFAVMPVNPTCCRGLWVTRQSETLPICGVFSSEMRWPPLACFLTVQVSGKCFSLRE